MNREWTGKYEYVHQSVFGKNGDCLRACICTITGYSVEEVPNFGEFQETDAFWGAVKGFIRERGGDLVPVSFPEWDSLQSLEVVLPFIVIGEGSLPERNHAVVYYPSDGTVHDPHPGKVLAGPMRETGTYLGLFIVKLFHKDGEL